jgi:two-component system chemotaxis response regulator CheY
MVVDDSAMVRAQVGDTLRDAGYGVTEATDGIDGLDQLSREPTIALVVLDVNMPTMNGLDMLRELRVREAIADIPVVMLTTEGHPQLMRQAKQLGAKGWIIKPFRPDLLVAAVRRLTI